MTTDKNPPSLNITIYVKPIKQASKFIYVGHKLSSTNDGTAAVKYQIGLGWAAFEKNKNLLVSKRIPIPHQNEDLQHICPPSRPLWP